MSPRSDHDDQIAAYPHLRSMLEGDDDALAALDRLADALCPVVEGYGAHFRKDSVYYDAAEALGIERPLCEELGYHVCGPILGRCSHGVDLDRDFCPEGCRV